MIWFLRGLVFMALGAVIGVYLYHFVLAQDADTPPALVASAGTETGSGTVDDPPTSDPSVPLVLPGGIAGDLAGNMADDVQASELKHPLTRSLGQMIESNRGLFDQIGAEGLGDSLAEADALLWETKQQNQDALREANRQVRIAGSSPNVVLIAVEGLTWNPEDGLDALAADMPALYRIATQGRYGSLAAGLAPEEQRRRLVSGNTAANAANQFSQSLWNSGYATALIGNAWWWGAADSTSDWDAWLGFHSERLAKPFPETVWSNGQPLQLTANANGQQAVAAGSLFLQETHSYLARNHRGRPFTLVLSLGHDTDQASHTDVDTLLNEIDIRLNQLELAERTLLIVAGISPSADQSDSHGRIPMLVVRHLRRVPMGVPLPAPTAYQDILPTVLQATASQRIAGRMDGRSQWATWTTPPANQQ